MMPEQYTVNQPETPLRKAAVNKRLDEIKKLAMTPEATLTGDEKQYFVKVSYGSVTGIDRTFPVVSKSHGEAIVVAINGPLERGKGGV